MSTPSGTDSPASRQPSADGGRSSAVPGSWLDALASLVADRAALFRYESKAAASQWARTAVLLVIAALAATVAWLLLVAGAVAALATATGWAWPWVAFGAAALHLVVAGVCLVRAKSAKSPAFPLSRNEFLKDQAWLKSLTTPRK